MSRDELEATIRAQITRVISNALTAGVPSSGMMNRATELILDAADAYAAGDAETLTALRREVLRRERDDLGGDMRQTPASTRGGVTGTAPELNPPGSGAFPQGAGDGGATLSTEASIPGVFTSRYGRLSTGVDSGYPQGGAS